MFGKTQTWHREYDVYRMQSPHILKQRAKTLNSATSRSFTSLSIKSLVRLLTFSIPLSLRFYLPLSFSTYFSPRFHPRRISYAICAYAWTRINFRPCEFFRTKKAYTYATDAKACSPENSLFACNEKPFLK